MSCCNNEMHYYPIENYCSSCNPTNFTPQDKTYTIADTYYAPPWPAERSKYDQNLQTRLNTASIPDFLNYSNTPKKVLNIGQLDFDPVHSHPTFDMFGNQIESAKKETRKSVHAGRYDNYSF